jgi:prepilin-type N-terminal cleavage/methylation domain-containing protein
VSDRCSRRRPAARRARHARRAGRAGLTLIELLVSLAVVALLFSLLMPGLAGARGQARRVKCASNLRQLGIGFHMYAGEHGGKAMPLAYSDATLLDEDGAPRYWWGVVSSIGVDHRRGFLWPYLKSPLAAAGLFECPEQPWGSYVPQGAARTSTSTYGYNGYYLCPPHTPGWSLQIGRRPWQNVDTLRDPQRLFVFADTALPTAPGAPPQNNALLDPPWLYQRGRWVRNLSPTTSFRHAGQTNAFSADGHVGVWRPHYVPDWREW